MTVQYEEIEITSGVKAIKNIKATFTDNPDRVLMIPVDESNSDYQRYLRWLENPDAEEGGTL